MFVERKTHRESWKGEESVKDRITLPKGKIVEFLDGTYTLDMAMREGKVSGPSTAPTPPPPPPSLALSMRLCFACMEVLPDAGMSRETQSCESVYSSARLRHFLSIFCLPPECGHDRYWQGDFQQYCRVQLPCNSNDEVLNLYKVETGQKQSCCKMWIKRRSCSTQASLWPKPLLLKRGRIEV